MFFPWPGKVAEQAYDGHSGRDRGAAHDYATTTIRRDEGYVPIRSTIHPVDTAAYSEPLVLIALRMKAQNFP